MGTLSAFVLPMRCFVVFVGISFIDSLVAGTNCLAHSDCSKNEYCNFNQHDLESSTCDQNADEVLNELRKGSVGTEVLKKADYWHWRVYSYTTKLKNKDYGGIVKTLFNYFTRQT